MKVILFNGPPRSGKDTAANIVARRFNATKWKFATSLKNTTHNLYGLTGEGSGFTVGPEYYETTKDIPNDDFFGLTPREAYIKVSEEMVKPILGKQHFGKVTARMIQRHKAELNVISDSGFTEEAAPVITLIGAGHIMLYKIERPGCDFSKDSRSYLNLPVETKWLTNGGKLFGFTDLVIREVAAYLGVDEPGCEHIWIEDMQWKDGEIEITKKCSRCGVIQ